MKMHSFKGLCLVLATLLATSTARSVPVKRATTEYVIDGSFEDVPKRIASDFEHNVRAGGWAVQGNTIFTDNTPGDKTPYGKNYVVYYKDSPKDVRGSVSQKIEGLPSATLTFSYYYRIFEIDLPNCTFAASFGPQIIDSLVLPVSDGSQGDFTQRTQSFTPLQSSGLLSLELRCPKPAKGKYFELELDNVSLTGPSVS